MEAWVTNRRAGQLELIKTEVALPEIKNTEVLIEVKSIGINPVDIQTLRGCGIADWLNFDKPVILGWDISGEIIAAGKGVTNFKIGDEVFGMINFPREGKAYATYVAASVTEVCLKPGNISNAEAAAASLAALTAWQAVVVNAKITGGQKVLIHAASGGVGHFAVQMANLFGALVTGTSSAKNKDFICDLGAQEHWDYTSAKEKNEGKFDFVLDSLGGENVENSFPLIKKGGILISLPKPISHELTAKARLLDIQAYYIQVHSNAKDLIHIAKHLESGAIKSFVTHQYNFNELPNALEQIATGRTQGKIVVNL